MKMILEKTINNFLAGRALSKLTTRLHLRQSFSQNGEDIIVASIAGWLGISIKVFLDIGAHDPVSGNNTYYFNLRGATGVGLEPNKRFRNSWRTNRPNDTLITAACGSSGVANYYEMDLDVLSTLSEQHVNQCVAQGHVVRSINEIEVVPLDDIVERHPQLLQCDFMSIDVEGGEEDILATTRFQDFRPKIIAVETLEYGRDFLGAKRNGINKILCSHNYTLVADTMLNTVFVDSKFYTG